MVRAGAGHGGGLKPEPSFSTGTGCLWCRNSARGGRLRQSGSKDLEFYPDAVQAVCRLKAMGFVVIVATNQPDVGKGLVDEAVISAMHARLREAHAG